MASLREIPSVVEQIDCDNFKSEVTRHLKRAGAAYRLSSCGVRNRIFDYRRFKLQIAVNLVRQCIRSFVPIAGTASRN